MTVDLMEVEKTFRKRMMRRYRNQPLWEDAYQEGLIRAWKDIEEGGREFAHIINRADAWARNVMFDRNTKQTGEPRRSTFGGRKKKGDETRVKISEYMTEFHASRGRLPSKTEIATELGLHVSSIAPHLTVMQQGNTATFMKGETTRVDLNAYGFYPLEWQNPNVEGDLYSNEVIARITQPSFEDEWLAHEHFFEIISVLDKEDYDLMILRFYYDWTTTEIGESYFGYTTSARQKAHRKVNNVLKKLRENYAVAST